MVDAETLADLERLKEIWSHEMPRASLKEVICNSAKMCIEKLDPLAKARRAAKKAKRAPAPEGKGRHIPKEVAHAVWLRDESCTFVDAEGRRCGSRHKLELHHLREFSLGGEHSVENLTLHCFAHNQRRAMDSFGSQVLCYAD